MKSWPACRDSSNPLTLAAMTAIAISVLFGGASCKKESPSQPVVVWYEGELARSVGEGQRLTLIVPESMYSDAVGRLATLYSMAVGYPDLVPAFVRNNRAAFQNVQQLSQCAAKFESAVMQRILSAPTRDEVHDNAMKLAGSDPDLQRLASDVTDGGMKTLADLHTMAQWFNQLSGSLAEILRGNDDPYHQTQAYALAKMLETAGGWQVMAPGGRIFFFNCNYVSVARPALALACR